MYGQGVVLDTAQDGYLRAFFGVVGERRVPIGSVRSEMSRTERILRAVDGNTDRDRGAANGDGSYSAELIGYVEIVGADLSSGNSRKD